MIGDKLAVIDMQKVYESGAPWECDGISGAADNIARLIESDALDDISFTRFVLSEKPYGSWIRYQAQYGSIHDEPARGDLIESLAPYAREHTCFDKEGYSAYRSKDFAAWAGSANRLVIAGVVAECCVLATVLDAADRGANVIWLTDAIAGTSADKKRMAETILAEDFAPHVTMMTTDEYLRANKKD
ncbi:MAG: cysteine hydrolase [Selenomonadales bacterium]|nr:cysteine hydrolase [Selenomonadales bacterium]